jgi:metal-responsive CopG/Arc/MetJ family transcriptional regulator
MERQNVTLSLPKRLLKKAKVAAAQQEKSLSELMREALEQRISQGSEYDKAKKRHLKLLGRGLDLGSRGKLAYSREELHDRR